MQGGLRRVQRASARAVILDIEGNMTIRFIIYGLLGWCGEIIWTATREKLSGQQASPRT
jgi:hypothetical protein